MTNNRVVDYKSKTIKNQTNYAIYRILIGALIGLLLSFVIGYLFACYKNGINVTVGLRIFQNPFIGMGLIGICFFGTIIGSLASMFSRKWNKHK